MSLDQKLTESSLVRQLARLSGERESWRKLLDRSAGSAKQLEALAAQVAGLDLSAKGLQPFALTVSEQLKALSPGGATVAALKEWHESQRLQRESIQKMLEPLDAMRQDFLVNPTVQAFAKQLADGNLVLKELRGASDFQRVNAEFTRIAEESRKQSRALLESLGDAGSIRLQFKELERVNKTWQVPPEVLGVVGSLRELQDRYGDLTFPTIDLGSAAAIASLIGREGLEQQLSRLGIRPDGSLDLQAAKSADRGILSRKQPDPLVLLGLLLNIVAIWIGVAIFLYQERSGDARQAANEEVMARQSRQLESLNALVERALAQASASRDVKFVVRDRVATVRSRAEHGSSIEAKLMPREVVSLVESNGKWIKVEYYHWLHQEYRTGWVLKKYLQRVPANFKSE